MAKIKLGAFVTDISGKLGGLVFATNKGGAYVRRKSTAVNPQTLSQMGIRGMFGTISRMWSAVSEQSRDSFNGAVEYWKQTDIFGDSRAPSGKVLFQKINMNRQLLGLPLTDIAELPKGLSDLAAHSPTFQINSPQLTLDISGIEGGDYILVDATPPVPAGKSFVKNLYRKIYSSNDGDGGVDLFDVYTSLFGVPPIGSTVYISIRSANEVGQVSPAKTYKLTVV